MSDDEIAKIQGKRIAKLEDGFAEVKTDLAVGSEMFRQIRKEVGDLVEEDKEIHGKMQTSLETMGQDLVRATTVLDNIEKRMASAEIALHDHIGAEHPHPNAAPPAQLPPPQAASVEEEKPPVIIPRGRAERWLALILQYGGREVILVGGVLGGMWLLNQWGIIGV